MRSFFGGTYIEKEKLAYNNIYYPVRLEYYKIDEESNQNSIYGIEIVKTEYQNQEKPEVTREIIKGVTTEEKEINILLEKFKLGTVTPITAVEMIEELSKIS